MINQFISRLEKEQPIVGNIQNKTIRRITTKNLLDSGYEPFQILSSDEQATPLTSSQVNMPRISLSVRRVGRII